MADKIGIQAGASTAQAYEWTRSNYGIAALNVHERALSTLRAQEQRTASLYLDVNPGSYRYGSTIVLFAGGISPVFSPPVAGTRLDVLYLDCTSGTLAIEEGTAATVITDALELPDIPDQAIPLVAVHLAAGQASITEADLYDMRPFLTADPIPWSAGADDEVLTADGAGGATWETPSASAINTWGVASSSTEISRDSSTFASAISKTVTLTKTCLVNLQFQAVAKTGSVGNPCQVQFYEGTTALGKPCDQSSAAYAPINLCWALQAAAGAHTYEVRYRRNGGSGSAYLDELVLVVTAFPL